MSRAEANPGGSGRKGGGWPVMEASGFAALTALCPQLALRNALRYFPPDVQEQLAPEFAQELRLYGHIYMYRFCPNLEMK